MVLACALTKSWGYTILAFAGWQDWLVVPLTALHGICTPTMKPIQVFAASANELQILHRFPLNRMKIARNKVFQVDQQHFDGLWWHLWHQAVDQLHQSLTLKKSLVTTCDMTWPPRSKESEDRPPRSVKAPVPKVSRRRRISKIGSVLAQRIDVCIHIYIYI